MTKKILFIGHSAHRSGAPIVLLDFLRWLRRHDDVTFDVTLVHSGALLPEFQAVARTEVLRREPSLARRLLRRTTGCEKWDRLEDKAFARRVRNRGYDAVYVNTIVPTREILALAGSGVPVIWHVHELDTAVSQWVGAKGVSNVVPHVTHFIAASTSVRDYLVMRWNVPSAKISVIHSFTTIDDASSHSSEARSQIRLKLGVADDQVLVGNCGTLDWRKGADLFVQIVRLIAADKRGSNIRFVWVGADHATLDYARVVHDLRMCEIADRVTLVENTASARDFFAAMDVFALSSREDPFPLVMLEAASMAVPLVCFASSGGAPEFAGQDAGLIAPYLDLAAFKEHVLSLAKDAAARARLGAAASRKVRERFTIEHQAPKLRDAISAVTGS
jgi:glycosyltransferase involved in cell wall biosynthesis